MLSIPFCIRKLGRVLYFGSKVTPFYVRTALSATAVTGPKHSIAHCLKIAAIIFACSIDKSFEIFVYLKFFK